jgi:hypothetical protein
MRFEMYCCMRLTGIAGPHDVEHEDICPVGCSPCSVVATDRRFTGAYCSITRQST